MNPAEFVVCGKGCWRNIPFTLVDRGQNVKSPVYNSCDYNSCESRRFKRRIGGEGLRYSLIRQSDAAKQGLKTRLGMKLVELRIDFQVDHILIVLRVSLLQ
jgi:hypothetical protein